MGLSTVQLEMQSGKEPGTGERDLVPANGRLKPFWVSQGYPGEPRMKDKGRGGVSGKAGWGR